MKIGLSTKVITPSFPVLLAGFAEYREAHDKYDDLFVKVITCEIDHKVYGIINFDLVGIDSLILDIVKENLTKKGLDYGNFIVSATHTHSGPHGILKRWGESKAVKEDGTEIPVPIRQDIVEVIANQAIQAITEAVETAKDGHVKIAKSKLEGIGKNRNSLEFSGNNDIVVIYFEQDNGEKAVAVNFACHPTVLNMKSKLVSADIPGAMNKLLKENGYYFAAYLNGSCGDISTRFTRIGNGYEEVKRYGQLLADKVNELYETSKNIKIDTLQVKHLSIVLQYKQIETVEEAEKKLNDCYEKVVEAKKKGISGGELRVIESFFEGARFNLDRSKNPPNAESEAANVSIFNINHDFFVCVPGELFSQLSNPIQNEYTHFIGYADGYLGYFADNHAYENGFYEALSSPFDKGQSELMMKVIKNEIEKMK